MDDIFLITQLIGWGVMVGTLAFGALTLAGFFGEHWYWFDICDHFRMQYIVILILMAIMSLLGQQFLWAFIAFGFMAINIFWITPIFMRSSRHIKSESEFRLFLSNILRRNRSYQKLLNEIKVNKPDVIALVEVDQPWLDAIQPLAQEYPTWCVEPHHDNFGLAIISRFPTTNCQVSYLSEKGNPILVANLIINGNPMRIIVVHPPPPKNGPDNRYRNQEIELLAEFVDDAIPTILCGDFNISPWAMPFRLLQRKSNLVDSTRGFGFQPTWPVNRFWLRVPIDHCLASPEIDVINRKIGKDIGSDHFPVIVDFAFKKE